VTATREQIREVWRLHMKLAADVPADRAMALGVASICEQALAADDERRAAKIEALEWVRLTKPNDEEIEAAIENLKRGGT
jgi:hypothetical protein